MPTLAQAEETLVGPAPTAGAGLVGAALASAGFLATGASPVVALAPAISQALMACGITPVDITTPTDADLAGLSATTWPKFLDIAWLLLLEQAAGSMMGGTRSITFEDYSKSSFGPTDLAALLEARRKYVRGRWGWGGAKVFAGTIQCGPPDAGSEF